MAMPLGFDTERLARIERWMERYVEERKLPGASVLIQRHGREAFAATTGRRDVEEGLPFERDTIVRLYSMTKPVTSVAIMMLAEQGLFHLDAPVSEFIPAFSTMQALVPGATRIDQVEASRPPSLHNLLTHTSGLSYPFNPGVLAREMDERKILFGATHGTLEETADRAAALPLAFQPGTRWEYSISTDILGRVVEVVSGKSLDRFFAEEILDPLEMIDTSFRLRDDQCPRFAASYTPLSGDAMDLNAAEKSDQTLRLVDHVSKSPFRQTTCFSGGGGLVGTLDDYARFAEMLRLGGVAPTGRLLSPRTLAFMMRNHLPGDIASMGPKSFAEQPMEGMGFGLGGSVVLDPGRVRVPGSIGDFSWGGMASTFFWVDRELDMTVVFLTQLLPSSSYPLRSELKALVHGALVS